MSVAEAAPHPQLAEAGRPRVRIPKTLWIGLAIMLACKSLLFYDVSRTDRGALHTNEDLVRALSARPTDAFARIARYFAVNMTPFVWVGYLVFLEGVLTMQRGRSPIRSPIRSRPHHFVLLALASVTIWCVFDLINFYSIDAWRYLGMPVHFWDRFWGYLLAFATIVPGMLMSGQVFLNLGWFERARSPRWRMPRWVAVMSLVIGAAMAVWPLLHPDPITNLTLWCGLVFMVDPINLWLGRPSMFRDWQNGWYGRTLAAFAGGLLCGLLWEFWNYWALAKWTYNLPFLGSLEHVRYFEMPVLGLLGFVPFGIECWIMWQFMRISLDGLAEPLPSERDLI